MYERVFAALCVCLTKIGIRLHHVMNKFRRCVTLCLQYIRGDDSKDVCNLYW